MQQSIIQMDNFKQRNIALSNKLYQAFCIGNA